ncbi:Hypothetical predicted protein [Paramuricea clavata]|uniref:Uncharacterized protein n=1 Tax=Paramuricea clavata TaxID=317549 RepID=A0A7D9DUL0_PARCT|nr:Hypothetical predicted protein [Paramuricea clavata]
MAEIKITVKLELEITQNENQHEHRTNNGHTSGINIREMRCNDNEICPVCGPDFTQRQRASLPLPEL